MNCCQCQGIESTFDRKTAEKDLKAYRKKGPSKTTTLLLKGLKRAGVTGMSLLDIGGGVGTIQHELASFTSGPMVNVDASTAYLEAAREEARRRNYVDRVSYQHGDFVALAPSIETADVVTLDRVICCYHDVEALVNLSAARTGKLYGLVYPRDTWWMKLFGRIANAYFRLRRNPFRLFVHPTQVVESLVQCHGLKRRFYERTTVWQVAVYERGPGASSP
jgi:magnesium-protoporphyrin O-methyltransferase